jgi:hypothetical protein
MVAGPEPVLAHLGGANWDVIGGPAVSRRPQESATVTEVDDPGYRGWLLFCSCDFFRDCGHEISSMEGEFAQA